MTDIINRLVEELQGYITAPSAGGWVALGLYALAAILVIVGFFKGLGRGMSRQLVRTLTVVASMVLSVWICLKVGPAVIELCEGRTLGGVLEKLHLTFLISGRGAFTPIVSSVGGDGLAYLLALPMSVIALPALMVVSFMIIIALMLFVHAIICYIFGWTSYCNNIFTRIVGCIIGAVQGALVAAFVLVGVFSATGGLKAMASEAPSDSRMHTTYTTFLAEADNSVLAKAVRKCGGNALKTAMDATLAVDGEAVDTEGMSVSAGAILGYAERLEGADFKALTEEQTEALRAMLRYSEDSPEMTALVAAVVRGAADSLADYEATLPFREPFLTTLTDFIAAQSDLADEHLHADVSAVLEAYLALTECGALRAETAAEAIACLSETDESGLSAAHRAYRALYENERTRPLVRTLTEYTLLVLADGTDISRDGLFAEVRRGTVEILSLPMEELSKEARVIAVATAMQQMYADCGLSGDFERFRAVAAYTIDTYGDIPAEALTDEQLCDGLLAFFDIPSTPNP